MVPLGRGGVGASPQGIWDIGCAKAEVAMHSLTAKAAHLSVLEDMPLKSVGAIIDKSLNE